MAESPVNTALQHGQSLEAQGRIPEALAAYDQAIAVSRSDARAHGVAWMNRGNALQKLDAKSLGPAVEAYDRAIALFSSLPVATDLGARNHLGSAWLNRGHALLLAEHTASAIESFERSIALLEQLPVDANPHFRLNLTGARVNLAHILITGDPIRARVEAQAALALLADVDRLHPIFAEMSLRARRAFVMAVGANNERELIIEATDAIDDGLAIVRHWESHQVTGLRPLAVRLFRLGAQLYRVHQPHFLAEYVIETLAVDAFAAEAEFREAAEDAVELALAGLIQPAVLELDNPASARFVETSRSLHDAQARLAAIRAHFSSPSS